MMSKKITATSLLFFIFMSFSCVAIANDAAYDRQEAIRRAAKQLVEIDNYQQKQAKNRADEKERKNRMAKYDDSSGGTLCCSAIIIILVAVAGFKYMAAKEREEEEELEEGKEIKTQQRKKLWLAEKERRLSKIKIESQQVIQTKINKENELVESLLRVAKKNGFSLDEQNKKCTQCAELIKLEAKTCRYCNKIFADNDVRGILRNALEKFIKEKKLSVHDNCNSLKASTESISQKNNKSNYVDECIRKGIKHHKATKYKEAIVAFSNALEKDKQSAQAHFYRACTYQKLNDKENQNKDVIIAAKLGYPKAIEFIKKAGLHM